MQKKIFNDFYLIWFPIASLLSFLGIALFLIVNQDVGLLLLYIVGVSEAIFGKIRANEVMKVGVFKYLPLLFILTPSVVFLFFNNDTQGTLWAILLAIALLALRCYLSLKTVNRTFFYKAKKSSFSFIFIIGLTALISCNLYLTNFYNHVNMINWDLPVSGTVTSNIKVKDNEIRFLVNDDTIRKSFYNLPQTYVVNKDDGEIISKKGGYEFPEDFKPYKNNSTDINYRNYKIYNEDNILYIQNLSDNKIVFKFITNGQILSTPFVDKDSNLYIVSNNWSWFDRRTQVKVYSLNLNGIFKK